MFNDSPHGEPSSLFQVIEELLQQFIQHQEMLVMASSNTTTCSTTLLMESQAVYSRLLKSFSSNLFSIRRGLLWPAVTSLHVQRLSSWRASSNTTSCSMTLLMESQAVYSRLLRSFSSNLFSIRRCLSWPAVTPLHVQ